MMARARSSVTGCAVAPDAAAPRSAVAASIRVSAPIGSILSVRQRWHQTFARWRGAVAYSLTAAAAARITVATSFGLESIATWLVSSVVILAFAAFAIAISASGAIIRSFLATTYQVGFAV